MIFFSAGGGGLNPPTPSPLGSATDIYTMTVQRLLFLLHAIGSNNDMRFEYIKVHQRLFRPKIILTSNNYI